MDFSILVYYKNMLINHYFSDNIGVNQFLFQYKIGSEYGEFSIASYETYE